MKTKLLALGALLTWLCSTTQAQIPVSTNTAAPPVGADDVYYLPGAVDEATGAMTGNGSDNTASGDNDVLTYVAHNKGGKGQSFTTGSNPNGYLLKSFTVRNILWTSFLGNGTFMSVANGSSFYVRIGTISGTTLTPIVSTNAVYSGPDLSMNGGSGTGLYFTFDLSSLGIGTLSPNTTYFVEIAAQSNPCYFELHNTRNGSLFAGGDAFYGTPNGALDADGDVTLSDGDFAFHAQLLPGGGPTVTAVATPSGALPGQPFTVTATATPGVGGSVTGVTIDLSSIGGSVLASLVHASGNDYTNTFTVPGGAMIGSKTFPVTATDASSLSGFIGLAFTVLPATSVWDGGSLADDNWSSAVNWLGDAAPPASGSSMTFAGNTRLTPNMDGNYSITGLTFSNTAGSFVVGSSTGSTLTNGGGIVNNSANVQTLGVPIVLSASQTVDAAAGDIVLSNRLTTAGGAAVTKAGVGALTFAGQVTHSLGNTLITNGLVKITDCIVNLAETSGALTKIDSGAGVEVSGGGTLNISGAGGWFPVGDSADTTNSLTLSGGTVTISNNFGLQVPRIGNGILTINGGTFVNNDSGSKGLSLGDNSAAQAGAVNLNGGRLIANLIVSHFGANQFYFNGGTLSPVASRTDFMNDAGALSVEVRNGGAIIDTAGSDITIAEHLLHSTVSGDNATDGGLTKIGNGVLVIESDASGYNGATKVLGGALLVNISFAGVPATAGDLLVSNATFAVSDTVGAAWPANNIVLTNGAALAITNTPTASGISAAGNLTLAGSIIRVNLQSMPAVAPISVAGGLAVSGVNTIVLSGLGVTAGSTFPVVDYSGTPVPTNSFVLSLPPGSNGYLSNNVANTSLDVVITASGQNLGWHGADAANSVLLPDWDINVSANWYDPIQNAAKYLQYNGNSYGDNVTFGDQGFNLTGTNSVNLPVHVVPASVAINGTAPYTFTGPGGIDGATSLVKANSGYALIGTSNNFTGGAVLSAGTLAITSDAALGASSGALTIAGGTLQFAGNVVSSRPVGITGGATLETLAGVSAQLGGVITNGTVNLTNTGAGTLTIASSIASNLNNLVVNGGTLKITNGAVSVTGTSGGSLVNANGTLDVATGGALALGSGVSFYSIGNATGANSTFVVNGGSVTNNAGNGTVVGRVGSGTLTINGGIYVDNSSAARGIDLGDQTTSTGGTLNLNGGTLVTKLIRSVRGTGSSGAIPCYVYFNGGTLMAGAGNTAFLSATTTKISTQIRNNGGRIDNGGFAITIGDPLLHSAVGGDNAIDGGLILQGAGTTMLNGVCTYNGPTVINAGTLAGTGTIAGSLTNNATLSPGNNGVGTMTINGAIRLNAGSTNTFIVNGTTVVASNRVAVGSSVVYGGVLNVIPSGTFTNGQTFTLFTGAGAASPGSFASIAGSPGSGLAFSFTNGVLSVVSGGPSGPAQLTNSYSGGVLNLSWPTDQGWKLQVQTNSLSTGLSTNWTYLTDGSVSSTNVTVDPAKPAVFYRLVYP